ncbi:MAG: hypothetical protein HUN04_16430 [Desulfobacter sp.]|nr:MAG: hypothetical protein HUN04_16430 [Desulfobacter sp.]
MRVRPLIRLVFIILVCGFSLAAGTAPAGAAGSHCIREFDTGAVNWSTGKVLVTGKAAPEAGPDGEPVAMPGSARAHAIRNIIAILKQIPITPDLSVGEYASSHDVILAGIEKTAQDAAITRQIYTSAMDVEVRMEAPVFGGFLQLVLPDHIRQIPKISEQKPKPGKPLPDATPPSNRILYSGLIVDARGLGFEPILYPTIVGEQGREVYSSLFVSREFAVQYGVVTYSCEMSTALSFRRIGSNPLVFKALRRGGDKTGALVVSLADAKALEKATERHRFLKECRVVIVLD